MNVLLALCLLALQPAALWCRSVDARAPSPSPRSSESESESWESQEVTPVPAPPHRNNIAELLLPLIERGLSAERRPTHAKKVIQVVPMRNSKESRTSSWPHLNSRKKHVVEITPLRSKGRDGKPLAYILSPAKSDLRRPYAKRTDKHHAHHEHKDHAGHHAQKKRAKRPTESKSLEERSEENNENLISKEEQLSNEAQAEVSEEYEPAVSSEELEDKSENKANSESTEPNQDSLSSDQSKSDNPETDTGSLTQVGYIDYGKSTASDSIDSNPDRESDDGSALSQTSGSKDDSEFNVSKASSGQFMFPESDSGDAISDKSVSENNDLSQSDDPTNESENLSKSPSSESKDKSKDESKSQVEENTIEGRSGDVNTVESGDEPENHSENIDKASSLEATLSPIEVNKVESTDDSNAANNDDNSVPKTHVKESSPKSSQSEENLSKKSHEDEPKDENKTDQSKLVKPDAIDNNTSKNLQDKGGLNENAGKESSEKKLTKELREEKIHIKSHHEHKHLKEESEYSRTAHKHSEHSNEDKKPISDKITQEDHLISGAEEQKQVNGKKEQNQKLAVGESVERHGNEYNLDEEKLEEKQSDENSALSNQKRRKSDNVEDSKQIKSETTEKSEDKKAQENSNLKIKHGDSENRNTKEEENKKEDEKSQKDENPDKNETKVDKGDHENDVDLSVIGVKSSKSAKDNELEKKFLKESIISRSSLNITESRNEVVKVGQNTEESAANQKVEAVKPVSENAAPAEISALRRGNIEDDETVDKELQTSPTPDYQRDDLLITQQDALSKIFEPRSRDVIEVIQSSEGAENVTPARCESIIRSEKPSEHPHEHKSYRLSFLFNK